MDKEKNINDSDLATATATAAKHFILLAIVLAAIYWFFESLMHVFLFHEGTLFQYIFYPDIHEIWMRLFAIGMIILLLAYAHYMINRLKKEKNKIRHINKELDQIFNTAADGMRLIDKNCNVLRINKTLSNMTGIDINEALTNKCYESFYGSSCRTPNCPLSIIMAGKEYVESDCEKERRDGKKISCIVTAAPFRGLNGELIGIVEDFKDITDRKEAEKELAKRAEELSRSNFELEQFAYVASHDLQEPLRMVVSFVQLLSSRYKGKLDANADDFINYAIEGTKRMQNLINDLLTYSRIGKKGTHCDPIDCKIVLDQALANLQAAIEESKAVITHEQLPMIMADNSQLVQIFQNLLSNAIKFKSEQEPRIHISIDSIEDAWIFSIHDNGIGIDPKYAERIFIIFQRLHSRAEYPGTGIGLAICKKIVERHGGQIWVKSESGKGATFYFTIPIKN